MPNSSLFISFDIQNTQNFENLGWIVILERKSSIVKCRFIGVKSERKIYWILSISKVLLACFPLWKIERFWYSELHFKSICWLCWSSKAQQYGDWYVLKYAKLWFLESKCNLTFQSNFFITISKNMTLISFCWKI